MGVYTSSTVTSAAESTSQIEQNGSRRENPRLWSDANPRSSRSGDLHQPQSNTIGRRQYDLHVRNRSCRVSAEEAQVNIPSPIIAPAEQRSSTGYGHSMSTSDIVTIRPEPSRNRRTLASRPCPCFSGNDSDQEEDGQIHVLWDPSRRSSMDRVRAPIEIPISDHIHRITEYTHFLIPKVDRIYSSCYYWGRMDRFKAESLLEGKPEGSFLLRDSAQSEYLFSVSFRRFQRTLHARIEQGRNLFSFDILDGTVFSATNVTDLIANYKDPAKCLFFEPQLSNPIPRNFAFSLQEICRAKIASSVRYADVSGLHLPPQLKSYIRELHYSVPWRQVMHGKRFEPRDLDEEQPLKRARLSEIDEKVAKEQPTQQPCRCDTNNNSAAISPHTVVGSLRQGELPYQRPQMEPNMLPDPNNMAFMHDDHAHYGNNVNGNYRNHMNQEADNIANRLQDIPIPFHHDVMQIFPQQYFEQPFYNANPAQHNNNLNRVNGQQNFGNMGMAQPIFNPFTQPPPLHLPPPPLPPFRLPQPPPVDFPQPEPVNLPQPQPVQLPQHLPHQQIPAIPLPGNPPELHQQAQQNRPVADADQGMPRLVPYNLRPLSPEAQAPIERGQNTGGRQRAQPALHNRPRIIPLEVNQPLNGQRVENALAAVRNMRIDPIAQPNRNRVAPNPEQPPIVPQENGLIRRINLPMRGAPGRIPLPPRRAAPGQRDRQPPRMRRPIELARLPNEDAEAYRARNQFFNNHILPKVRERDRLSKNFVRWMYPGVISTAENVANRINELRGEAFDIIKFLDHHDLLGAEEPYEEELQARFPATHEDILLELLAEQAEEYDRQDAIEYPRARSPSPDSERRENETGQQYFTRMFGSLAGKGGVSPAPGDVPENLEEALALLARVPNGQPPQRTEFDRAWYNRQLDKIRVVIQQELANNENKRRTLREKAAKDEALQLSYEIATMDQERRKGLWKKAIRRCAKRENIELQEEWGPNMRIPPRAPERNAPDDGVIVLGDSETEQQPAPAEEGPRSPKRPRFPRRVRTPPPRRCRWPRTAEEVDDVLNGIVHLDDEEERPVEPMDTQQPIANHDPGAPGPSSRP